MAGYTFTNDYLLELRDRNEISEVIAQFVTLKKTGSNLKGLCPFHNERTPSFTVFPDTQSFYCFGCGASGNVIGFVMKIQNLSFVDAVKFLAQRSGMPLPDERIEDSRSLLRRRVLGANKEAAKFFHAKLNDSNGRQCLAYYRERGYSDKTIKHFGLGYAPNSWSELTDHLHNEMGYSLTDLVAANLTRKSEKNGKTHYYDNFRNRAIIPIIDVRGNVIAFGARALDDSKPKYINTSETVCYKKGSEVFALNFAKDSGKRSLIVTEGYMDVIALHQAGFTNSIASLGTALPDEQVNLISRYADEVLLSYDSDDAGQKAVQRAITAFARTGVKVRVLKLTGGKDPDEIIKKYGPEKFRAIVDGAENDIEFTLKKLSSKYDLESDDGKISFMREAVSYLASIYSDIERDVYITRLSNDLNISRESIALQVDAAVKRKKREYKQAEFKRIRQSTSIPANDLPFNSVPAVTAAEETLLVNLMRNARLYVKLKDQLDEELFISDFGKSVFAALLPFLGEGTTPDLILLSGVLDEGHLSRLTALLNTKILSDRALEESLDCIKVIKNEKNNTAIKDPTSLSDEEFLKLFQETGRK